MKQRITLIAAILFIAGPALAQAPSTASPQKPAPSAAGKPTSAAAAHSQPASPAQATPQASSEAGAATEKVDPAKEASIRHLMDITESSKLGDNMATYINNQVKQVMSRALQPDDLSKFMNTFSQKFTANAPPSAVTDAMVPIYSKAFTTDEIQGLVKFYESPLGQHVVKVLPKVTADSQSAGMQIEQKAAIEVLRGMSDDYPELKRMLPPEGGQPQPSPGAGSAPQKSPNPAPPAAPAPAPPKP